MTILEDFLDGKDIIIVGTGVGERSRKLGYYYANLRSNCLWSALQKAGWTDRIPHTKEEFDSIMATSKLGFTDLVKDYSGSDNKVLSKYYGVITRNVRKGSRYIEKKQVRVNSKNLENTDLLRKDRESLLHKLQPKRVVIINGRPLMKILSGKDSMPYGIIEDEKTRQKIGLNEAVIVFLRNTVIRNEHERDHIEQKIVDILNQVPESGT